MRLFKRPEKDTNAKTVVESRLGQLEDRVNNLEKWREALTPKVKAPDASG